MKKALLLTFIVFINGQQQALIIRTAEGIVKALLYFFLVFSFSLNAQEIGSVTDERDGRVYETVSYSIILSDSTASTMIWMSQNLNYAIEKSRCFEDSEVNCDIYGRQYMYNEAMKACPNGWRLPTNDEWYSLVKIYGGISSAGLHMKSKNDLWGKGIGTNKSLFNGIPNQPVIPHNFKNFPPYQPEAIFWSSSTKNSEYAWDWKLVAGTNKVQKWEGSKKEYNCVRCVKN